MSINSSTALFDYGRSGPFASTKARPLIHSEFSYVLSFLSPKELAGAESVCKSWNRFIDESQQWKKQCQIQLNTSEDPMAYLPPGSHSYKEGLVLVLPRVLNENKYRSYLNARIEPAPPIPKSLREFNEPDSCAPTETKGRNYFWMYSPPYFEITVDGDSPLDLDKPDDPNDIEAPQLIERTAGVVESFFRLFGLGTKSEKRVLKVPNTINNLPLLFKYAKNGIPSDYHCVYVNITEKHGNKRIPSGWFGMREGVIGRNQTFAQQQAIAKEAGVETVQLGHRILFNFIRHTETNIYPDGCNPCTFARTSTLIDDSGGRLCPSDCGNGGPNGLRVDDSIRNSKNIGAAVALPAEVRASLVQSAS